jgi:hypothetical protein
MVFNAIFFRVVFKNIYIFHIMIEGAVKLKRTMIDGSSAPLPDVHIDARTQLVVLAQSYRVCPIVVVFPAHTKKSHRFQSIPPN